MKYGNPRIFKHFPVTFIVRTGKGTLGSDDFFTDAIGQATRTPSGERKLVVRYQGRRYRLGGGIRTNYFICLNNPLGGRPDDN